MRGRNLLTINIKMNLEDSHKSNSLKDKNLLIIAHSYSNFIKDQVEALSKYFNHIYVLVRHNPIADISEYLPVNYLKPFKASSIIDLTGKPDNVTVIKTNIIYFHTDNQYKKLGEKHFNVVDKILREKNIHFDLIHAHFTWSAGYVGQRLKEKYNIPFIVTAHGFDIYDLPFRDDEWKEKVRYLLNIADYVITVSNSNLDCIKKLNVRTSVKVIPNGFNSGLFNPRNYIKCRKVLNLPLDKKIILTVGNLVPVKGHKHLIDAMARIIERRRDVLCVIVGDGKLKNNIERQIKKLNLESYIRLVGMKPHDEIPLWMNAADLFVLTSLSEGNPTVMFECLGCGKPFMGTKVGGIPEIITSNDYGLLCKPADPDALAKNILTALDKKWIEEKIRKYAERFAWEEVAKEIIKVYEETLERRCFR